MREGRKTPTRSRLNALRRTEGAMRERKGNIRRDYNEREDENTGEGEGGEGEGVTTPMGKGRGGALRLGLLPLAKQPFDYWRI